MVTCYHCNLKWKKTLELNKLRDDNMLVLNLELYLQLEVGVYRGGALLSHRLCIKNNPYKWQLSVLYLQSQQSNGRLFTILISFRVFHVCCLCAYSAACDRKSACFQSLVFFDKTYLLRSMLQAWHRPCLK